jgi:hypothetical protein
MPDKRPLNVAALLADLINVRLPGPELYTPARDGKITLPGGERHRLFRMKRYLGVWYQGKSVLHHRMVARLVLGVRLSRDIHVHHVNHNRHDNRPENLLPMSGRKHLQLERLRRPLLGLCDYCGSLYSLSRCKNSDSRKFFCGQRCRLRHLAEHWAPAARRIARSHQRGHTRAEIERARRDPAFRWPGWL